MAVVGTAQLKYWERTDDDDGHRDYLARYDVEVDDADDGPQTVASAAGLPITGSSWAEGNDSDIWAMCRPYTRVVPRVQETNIFWTVDKRFSTRPLRRCQDESIEDPLLEPQKVSGSFLTFSKEMARDKDGELFLNSSHEQIRGPQVEFDDGRHRVVISQNVPDLQLALISSMLNTLNDDDLWGLTSRMIKLSGFSWERLLWGVCDYYYLRTFEFDVDYATFDRIVPDEGTMVLKGHWDPDEETPTYVVDSGVDADNPRHFIRYQDRQGNIARVLLDGSGLPANASILTDTGTGTATNPVATHTLQYYDESNFLLLGIPTEF